MKYLIDTSILVDYLRRFPRAESFVDQLTKDDRVISVITSMEIIRGCQTKTSLKLAKLFLSNFQILQLNSQISELAEKILEAHRFDSFIDIPDSLIAATAIESNLELQTINLKDFKIISGLKASRPY